MSRGAEPGRWIGYIEVIGAAALWGSSGIFSVHLFATGLPPESVALLRPVLGLVFLGAFFQARGGLRVSARALVLLAGLGGLLTGVFQLAYQFAVAEVGVPTTVALVYLAPAFVVAASGPLLGEWPTPMRVGLAVVSVTGVWMTVFGARNAEAGTSLTGVLWGALAGASYAGYTLFGRHASLRFGSPATAVYSAAGACLLLAVVLPVAGMGVQLPVGASTWALLALYALLTIAVATALFYDGLGRIEADRASIVTTAEPLVAAVLATTLLDQGLTTIGWLGLGLVVVSVSGAYASGTRNG